MKGLAQYLLCKKGGLRGIMFIVILFGIISDGFCQDKTLLPNGAITTSHDIVSASGTKYVLRVTTPPRYNPNKTHEVVYYLDAWWLEDLVRGAYTLNFLSHDVRPVVFVGITIDGNEKEWNIQRTRDYTISPYDVSIMKVNMDSGDVPIDAKSTGGADVFLSFMRSEVLPFIESTYPVNRNNSGFIGHSFGGLFGVYALMKAPEMFRNLILISPSLWWNKSEILSNTYQLSLGKMETDKNIFLGVGSSESKMLVNAILSFRDILEGIDSPIILNLKTYEGDDHQSLLPQAIYEGIDQFYGEGLKK